MAKTKEDAVKKEKKELSVSVKVPTARVTVESLQGEKPKKEKAEASLKPNEQTMLKIVANLGGKKVEETKFLTASGKKGLSVGQARRALKNLWADGLVGFDGRTEEGQDILSLTAAGRAAAAKIK